MTHSVISFRALGALAFAFTMVSSAAAQFEELLNKVPGTANSLALVNGEKLFNSPLAVKEGWKEKYSEAFASGLVSIPPDTKRMLLAAQMDYSYMKPLWELAIADFSGEKSLVDVARRTKGSFDNVGEWPAVVLDDDSYCVQLEATRLGVMAPANRQTVSRWLRDAGTRTEPAVSPYLKGALAASEKSQVVIAFDLQDAVPREIIRAKLGGSATLSGKNIDLDAAAKALASIRGMVLEVAITEGSYGRLMIHFGSDASILAPFAKPLLIEVLGNLGAMIDDLEKWEATTEPQKFTFHGNLSADGRKRVLLLIDHPTAALVASHSSEMQSANPQLSKEANASLQYFKTIQSMRDDLREKSAQTMGQRALWLDNAARRIDRLPILNVDEELLAYGRYITTRMRDASAALKGIGISSAARQAQVYQQYSSSSSGWGGYYGGGYSYNVQWNNVQGERRAIRYQERASGVTDAQAIAREVDNETVKIRQAMTQKYQTNF
jgi:hypothetical protein